MQVRCPPFPSGCITVNLRLPGLPSYSWRCAACCQLLQTASLLALTSLQPVFCHHACSCRTVGLWGCKRQKMKHSEWSLEHNGTNLLQKNNLVLFIVCKSNDNWKHIHCNKASGDKGYLNVQWDLGNAADGITWTFSFPGSVWKSIGQFTTSRMLLIFFAVNLRRTQTHIVWTA